MPVLSCLLRPLPILDRSGAVRPTRTLICWHNHSVLIIDRVKAVTIGRETDPSVHFLLGLHLHGIQKSQSNPNSKQPDDPDVETEFAMPIDTLLAPLLALGGSCCFAFGLHFQKIGLRDASPRFGVLIVVTTSAMVFWIFSPFFLTEKGIS